MDFCRRKFVDGRCGIHGNTRRGWTQSGSDNNWNIQLTAFGIDGVIPFMIAANLGIHRVNSRTTETMEPMDFCRRKFFLPAHIPFSITAMVLHYIKSCRSRKTCGKIFSGRMLPNCSNYCNLFYEGAGIS